jgi:hypothetical protein
MSAAMLGREQGWPGGVRTAMPGHARASSARDHEPRTSRAGAT